MRSGPEILAPAGDQQTLRAALQAGADAVYFGLAEGWNARARAANVRLDELPETVRSVHRAGARAYLALNTLVFDDELAAVEEALRRAAGAGIDAVIVQDPAVALLARQLCPSLPIHASTQMTLASADAARFAVGLGCSRVIAPRELTVEQLGALGRADSGGGPEVEAFVHGALCMSWSGQCMASLTFGGRSANRGRCAHPCRLPYRVLVDGQPAAQQICHPLSPRDLAGEPAVAELVTAGVVALKIEGRQKGAAYVMTAVRAVRAARDGTGDIGQELDACAAVFSRGFTLGYLDGGDHRRLVDGQLPGHLGAEVGRVGEVRGREQLTVLPAPRAPGLRPGQGIAIVAADGTVTGGPLHAVSRAGDVLVLRFGRPGPELAGASQGDRVFVSGDPALEREAEMLVRAAPPSGRIPIELTVEGRAGAALRAVAVLDGIAIEVSSSSALAPARREALDRTLIEEKLGALGGTPFRLERCRVELEGALHLPVSELKALRRALVERLTALVDAGPALAVTEASALDAVEHASNGELEARPGEPHLVALCRTAAQVEAAAGAGIAEVELEARYEAELHRLVDVARGRGLAVVLATLRVDQPSGADRLAEQLRRFAPDGVLVRNLGALTRLAASGSSLQLHGDATLNAANRLSARALLRAGLATITPALDVDADRLAGLCGAVPPGRSAVTLQVRVPLFHTEHCLFAHLLGAGGTRDSCGRPCDRHGIALGDRRGQSHPVRVDAACRNTVYAEQPRQLSRVLPALLAAGVRRFRVELLDEDGEQTAGAVLRWQDSLRAAGYSTW